MVLERRQSCRGFRPTCQGQSGRRRHRPRVCVLTIKNFSHNLPNIQLGTTYHVNNHQTGERREVLPPFRSIFGPALSPVDWPSAPGHHHPFHGISSMPPPPPPPPPGFIHPMQTPAAMAAAQQSPPSTEGLLFLSCLVFSMILIWVFSSWPTLPPHCHSGEREE